MLVVDQLQAVHRRVEFDLKRHTYAVDGRSLDGATKVIKETLAKGEGFLQWIANQGRDWRKVSTAEARIGTALHRVSENWARRRCGLAELPIDWPSAEAQYLAAGLPGRLDASGILPLLPETRLFDLGWGVAGTMDLAAMWAGALTIVDFKTCKTADEYYDEWSLQNACYRHMAKVHTGVDFSGLIMRIPKDGSHPNVLSLGSSDADVRAYEHLLQVYRWRHRSDAPATRKARVIAAAERFLEERGGA